MKRSNTVLSIALALGALGLTACGTGVAASDAAKPLSTPSVASAPTSTATPETAAPTTAATTTVATTDAPTTTAAPTTTEAVAVAVATVSVVNVVDGDTVDLSTGERVRIIGIDTPEQGQCGDDEATYVMAGLVLDRQVVATPGARDDVDKYGRILRYIDVDGVDAGREMIAAGYAVARYDSRDGYGRHTREDDYVQLDGATKQGYSCAPAPTAPRAVPAPAPVATAAPAPTSAPPSAPAPAPAAAPAPAPAPAPTFYANCDAVRAAGAAPIHAGEPGYSSKLDRDGDGIGCE